MARATVRRERGRRTGMMARRRAMMTARGREVVRKGKTPLRYGVHVQAIDAFVATADLKFGPITQIRKNGKVVKKIPWAAFQLSEADWERVKLCSDILAVSTHWLLRPHSLRTQSFYRTLTSSSNYARQPVPLRSIKSSPFSRR